MDPLSQLPTECLEHIIRILALADCVSLLQVNKFIASVTLPYLYTDPFQKDFHIRKDALSQTIDPRESVDPLVGVLLDRCRTEVAEFPEVLSVAYELDTDSKTTQIAGSLDYMSHIRHLTLGQWAIAQSSIWPSPNLASTISTSKLPAYIQGQDFQNTYCANRLLSLYANQLDPFSTSSTLLSLQLRTALVKEVNWALASPILDQLQSLTIPVSDIKRYLDVVDRLKDLEHVHFCLDEMLDYSSPFVFNDSARMEVLETTKVLKDEAMQDL
ncbi:hypothetical protein BGX29_010420, partial [Mortierella sp. GBA35]